VSKEGVQIINQSDKALSVNVFDKSYDLAGNAQLNVEHALAN